MPRKTKIKIEAEAAAEREVRKSAAPKTQYDCCLMAARAARAMGFIPANDAAFIEAAHAQARGLFGPAFVVADYGQKTAWIDMCERALREVASEA